MRASRLAQALVIAIITVATAAAEEGSFERTLDVSGPVELDVVTSSGSITVRAGTGNQVRVHGEIRSRHGDKIRRLEDSPPVKQDGNVVRVGHIDDEELKRGVSISYEIDVPPDTEIESRTGSGSQTIGDIRGPLDAKSGSGSLHFGRIGSDVEAASGSGSISIDGVDGNLDVRTGSGTIRAQSVSGQISAKSGSGSIEIDQSNARDASVRTGSGDIRLDAVHGELEVRTGSGDIEVTGEITGDWDLDAASGDITLSLPGEAAFDLEVETRSGDIDMEHPVTVRGRLNRRSLSGQVRGGGPTLAVHTASGDVRIR